MSGALTPHGPSGIRHATARDAALFYGLALLLVYAPLFLGTWRPVPLMIMELAAVALLAGLFMPRQAAAAGAEDGRTGPVGRPGRPSRPALLFLLLLFLLPLFQLVPLPLELWSILPGRAFYAEAMRLAGETDDGFNWRAISLIPTTTEAAWLTLLPPLAVFLAVLRLDRERLLVLVLVFLGIATGEALLGLIQYGNTLMTDSATGTYRNRNHLAGLLEMALPVGLALLAATVGHGRPRHAGRPHGRRKPTLRQWVARFSVARINQTAALGASALAILLGLIFTRSRAGISLAMLGILLSSLMFSYRLGGRNTYGLIGTFTAAGVGLASLIGLAPIWNRFAYADPFEDGRWTVFDATVQAIGEFFPLGSGAGTFIDVLRRFHPLAMPGLTINRAHNDYLEWLLEFGLIAAVLVAVWLLFYLRQWGRVWQSGEWTPLRFVQAGAGMALLLMMLHTLADYNLRVPANAVFTAFLAGVFFHQPRRAPARRSRRPEAPGENSGRAPPVFAIPPENQNNPFRTWSPTAVSRRRTGV